MGFRQSGLEQCQYARGSGWNWIPGDRGCGGRIDHLAEWLRRQRRARLDAAPTAHGGHRAPGGLLHRLHLFDNNSVGGSGYIWEFGEPGNLDVSYDAFPTWTYDGPGTYLVQLVTLADFQCPDTTTEVFEVAWLLEPFFETPDPECFQEHSFSFEAIGVTDPNATFEWNYAPGSAAIELGGILQGLTFPEPGLYTVEVVVTAEGVNATLNPRSRCCSILPSALMGGR